jgi:hypothetical protein
MQEFIYHEEGVYLAPQARPITYVLKESKLGTHCWHCVSHYSDGKVDYPKIARNGVRIRLSRYMYEREVTRIPDGYYILHACDNPFCINPDHLYAGTAKDNTQDAILKGRFNGYNYKNKIKSAE